MKKAEERRKVQTSQLMPIALLGMVSICCLFLAGCTQGEAAEQDMRPDLVDLADMVLFEEWERPSVQFPHDLHTEVVTERDEDCTVCHLVQADGQLSSKFKRLEDISQDEIMDLYHDDCIGCHQESARADGTTGPVACGDCHRRQPAYVSSRQLFGMDKSLHYRHIQASDDRCDLCHHQYDETKEELVYVEGEESSCRDCHRQQQQENRSAFRVAAHQSCIGCHQEPPAGLESDSPGPELCAGCHDLDQQLAVEEIEKPPRLERDQPDFMLISASEADLEASKLRTVPFSHVDHEENAASCRSCHHETLDACNECHTLTGSADSDGVTLYQAMHGMATGASCVGCHETQKVAAECAGCHDQMEQGRLSEDGCDLCHAGPVPERLEISASRFRSMDDFRPRPSESRLSFSPKDIPETVVIGILSDEFEPAEMPHRAIVEELRRHISDSSLARYFHEHEDVLCQGCHHQSPPGEKPPLCGSCHGTESAESDLFRPGLKGAYHQQCVGCHESMEIAEPSDCSGCHAEKENRVAKVMSSTVR